MMRITFPGRTGFYAEVRKRVNHYFETNSISKNADWRMVLKTAVIPAWLMAAYTLFLFFAFSLMLTLVSAIAVALGFLLVGFNIMHDGAHGSYCKEQTAELDHGFHPRSHRWQQHDVAAQTQYPAPHLYEH